MLIRTGVGALVREGTPMLTVVQRSQVGQAPATDVSTGSLIDDVVREGARRMLAAALEALNAPTSASLWADPRCSIWHDPRREEYPICTAVVPDAVLTVRRNTPRTSTLRPQISAQVRPLTRTKPQVSDLLAPSAPPA